MPLRLIVAYALIALLVIAVGWVFATVMRHRKREQDIMRGKISSHGGRRRRRRA